MGLTLISHTPTASLLELTAIKEMTAISPPQTLHYDHALPKQEPIDLTPSPETFQECIIHK